MNIVGTKLQFPTNYPSNNLRLIYLCVVTFIDIIFSSIYRSIQYKL